MIADNKAIVRRIHDQLNQGHFEIVDELYAPDYVSHIGSRTSDLQGFKAYLASHRAAFPDWTSTIEELIGEEDIIVARVTERGTQSGEWNHHLLGHLAPTHRVVESSRIIIRRFRHGRVVESWINADHLGMLHQTGAIRKVDTSA